MVRIIWPPVPCTSASQTSPPREITAPVPQPEPGPPVTYFIPAPPELEYDSAESAEAAIHAWTKDHAYNVSRSQLSRNANGDIRYRLLACVRSGKPKNTRKLKDADRQRHLVTSKRDGCGMRISIVAVDALNPTGHWKIVHTRDGSQTHNHPPSYDVRVHVPHRQRDAKRTNEVPDLVDLQAKAGVCTSKIYSTLVMSDKDTLVIPQDISNRKKKSRTQLLANQTSNEALFSLLAKNAFHYTYETESSSNRLRYLMWAHPDTTMLARHFMDVMVMDCTYNTNKFRLPLLNVIILTGMNTILPFAQIWMPGEAEPDFLWVLSTLKEFMIDQSVPMPKVNGTDRDLVCTNASDAVFPMAANLLCRWHIRRNVIAQAKKKNVVAEDSSDTPSVMQNRHEMQVDIFIAKFDDAINSSSESEFDKLSAEIQVLSPAMHKYLARTWWPYRAKFVSAWTNNYKHFGCHTKSPVEGTHAKMKAWLDNSRGDLLAVFQNLLPWWVKAARTTKYQAGYEMENIPVLFRNDTYSAVVKIISVHALKETSKKWREAHTIVVRGLKRSVCNGVFRRIHGRPCLHDLMGIIESAGALKLMPDHFDRHWWLPSAAASSTTRVLEPAPRQKRRRVNTKPRSHRSGYGINSTRRELSGFELLESTTDTFTVGFVILSRPARPR